MFMKIVQMFMGNLQVWVPAVVSIITLILNLCFYIFVQPKLTLRAGAKQELEKTSVELLNYMAEVVSYPEFEGVPTKIRKYSLQIHMQFKSGTAGNGIDLVLEKIYKEVKRRKTLSDENDIEQWDTEFRNLARELRVKLAGYCGTL